MGVGRWVTGAAVDAVKWKMMSGPNRSMHNKLMMDAAVQHQRHQISEQYRGPEREQAAAAQAEREAQRQYEKQLTERKRQVGEQEKAHWAQWAQQPRYTGGVHPDDPIVVRHHRSGKVPPVIVPSLDVVREGFPVLNGAEEMIKADRRQIDNPAFMEQAKAADALHTEVCSRYGQVLAALRRPDWWRDLCVASGVALTSTSDHVWQGSVASGKEKITTHDIPEIVGVRIAEDGLRLRIAPRTGDSAERWTSSKVLATLRAGFKAAGAPVGEFRVHEDSSGAIILVFDDAPSVFPAAVCLEPPTDVVTTPAQASRRYEGAAWMLGLDARGRVVKYALEDFPHVLATGGTGAGKSVWARSVIETLRTGYRDPDTGRDVAGGFTVFIGSGKPTDFATLHNLPGVAMVARDAEQTAVMVRQVRLEVERRFNAATDAKLRGETRAFDFPPILLLLDEWAATSITLNARHKSAASFESDVDLILRLAREARAHVGLFNQTIRKTGAGAIPGAWQANLGLTVSLGQPEPETLNNPGVFNGSTRARAEVLGSRIAGKKGRGMVTTGQDLVEFQSFYVWSPGTTSLDPKADKKVRPPTDEVAEAWARWELVSASVSALMPRLGIKALDPEWSKGDLDVVSDTATIPLTDRDGNPIPGREPFDPWSPSFAGRAASKGTAALSFDDDAPEPLASVTPINRATASEPDPLAGLVPSAAELAAMSVSERIEVLRLVAQIRGGEAAPAPEVPAAPDPTPAAEVEPEPADLEPTPKPPAAAATGFDF